MPEKVSTIIIGATLYGCGIALRRPGAVILEAADQPGSEFTLTGCPRTSSPAPLQTLEAQKFQQELLQRKIIERGLLHNAALAPFLAHWCLENQLAILLTAPVISYTQHHLTALPVSGLAEYQADEIIDARPHPGQEKYLYSFISAGKPGTYDSFEVLPTISPYFYLLRQKLPLTATYCQARAALFKFWTHRPEALLPAQLLWTGAQFSLMPDGDPATELERGLWRGER